MDCKEFLYKIIKGEISISQSLQLALLYYSKYLSLESQQWIKNEINGYNNSTQLPDYRLLDCILKVEVYSPFSRLETQTLDTSHINSFLEDQGVSESSPNKMRITQNIESIEKMEFEKNGKISMILNDGLKKMILDFYKYPSYAKFGDLYQQCSSEYIPNILVNVKNKLLEILRNEVLQKETEEFSNVCRLAKKKIFISYSWDNAEHKVWVQNLAKRLEDEFDVVIDVEQPLGTDINSFMEEMVSKADRVLLILTPNYKQKADNRTNGVGYESVLISDDLYNNQKSIKFVPILRKGSKKESFPKYLGNRKGLSMEDDNKFDENIKLLINDLKKN